MCPHDGSQILRHVASLCVRTVIRNTGGWGTSREAEVDVGNISVAVTISVQPG